MSERNDRAFYIGHGFDRVTGVEAQEVVELEERLAAAQRATKLAGNLYEAAVRADFPGSECLLPVNLLLFPERQFDFVLLRTGPGDGFPRHVHGYGDEVYLVIRGRGIVLLGDERHEAEAHDVFYIPAGTPHGYEVPAEAGAPFELFVVNVPAVPRANRSRYWAAQPVAQTSGADA